MRFPLLLRTTVFLALLTCGAQAQQEPFGQNMGVWKFTQAPDPAKIICRAISPGPGGSVNIIGRRGNGQFYVSVNSNGIPKGRYEESDIAIAGQHEPVNSGSDGQRYWMPVDDDQIARIIKGRGYQWTAKVAGKLITRVVSFDNMVGAAVARLRECTRANGGR